MSEQDKDEDAIKRVDRLFLKKLAAEQPDHPWVRQARSMVWQEPRPVDQWYWMQIELYKNGELQREGKVSWNKDGTGHFSVDIHIYEEMGGWGFVCWPDFRVLSEAQDFVERLMGLPFEQVKAEDGTQWPNVIL